nr:MAG TPA: transmembrane protein [Caudoviricetes sp.]
MTPQPTTPTLSPNPYVFVTIVFVILKLTGAIDWAWWMVLAPLWMPLVAVVGMVLLIALGTVALHLIARK